MHVLVIRFALSLPKQGMFSNSFNNYGAGNSERAESMNFDQCNLTSEHRSLAEIVFFCLLTGLPSQTEKSKKRTKKKD